MLIFANILFWIHLLALIVGGAATATIPFIAPRIPTASAETRPVLFGIMKMISRNAQIALGVLIITGPLILWLRYGGPDGMTFWFWVKMALVVVLLAGVIYSDINARRARNGDLAAARRSAMLGPLIGLVLIGVVFSAVFAFEPY